MRPMQRVPGLERDHRAPAPARELGTDLGRGTPQRLKVVVQRGLQPLEPAPHVHRVRAVEEVGHARMLLVRRAEDRLRLLFTIGRPQVFDVQRGEHHPLRVPQRKHSPNLELVGQLLWNVEGNRHRPERAAHQPHFRTDPFVVCTAQESREGGKCAVEQKLYVA